MSLSKNELRKYVKDGRQQLPIKNISEKICQHITTLEVFHQSKTVLSYFPFHDEVDLVSLVSRFPEKSWYFPRVSSSNPSEVHLDFYGYQPGDPLELHPYGMAEPLPTAKLLEDVSTVDLVILPALMLDGAGYRLGYGKGYYDRFIERLEKTQSTATLLSVVPDVFLVPQLPNDLWDRPVGIIVTEERILVPSCS